MKANAKKLYEHYVKVDYKSAIADMLNKYPEFAEVQEEIEPEVKHKKKRKSYGRNF